MIDLNLVNVEAYVLALNIKMNGAIARNRMVDISETSSKIDDVIRQLEKRSRDAN